MGQSFEYHVVSDGWIKIDSSDFYVGGNVKISGRLLIGLNQLLFRIDGKTVLIDAGLGDKWQSEKLQCRSW